ncbi:hypothetical protein SNE25_04510 [Mucilaginibacter sabulilitoris]|uniref:Uncharacterized protein n=1 Tax=Mucilaginibacter sabulilitoris TaxID=1173583 RepID=A0ABZ0TPF7_9SPHI|nr:hypothetical protein [Mucilaginibacter sabulilitoris]WPU94782.1 hypothetical protein SNE25_04510 [Mucilaginibacter sabulilitoris]
MGAESEIDWKQYIVENFFSTWEKLTSVDLTDYAFLIRHHFDVPDIAEQIGNVIEDANDPATLIKYHKGRICKLIRDFIDALLNISDDGKHITNKNIEQAKIVMQQGEDCIYSCPTNNLK